MATLTEADREYLVSVRKERDAFWAWLRGQPSQVSAVLAMRIGFRVLPFVVPEPVESRFTTKESREILSSFRYAALGRLSTRRPSRSLNAVATLLNSIAYAKGTSATAAICEASRAAPNTPGIQSRVEAAENSASRAAYAAMFSATSPAGAPWEAIAADRAWIEGGRDPIILLDQPMWLNLVPQNQMPEPHLSRWKLMHAALDDEDEGWRVWTEWYEDRLRGKPAQPDPIEYFRLTFIADAMTRIEDSSPEGLRRWTADIERNRALLRGAPRKANRIAAEFISEFERSR